MTVPSNDPERASAPSQTRKPRTAVVVLALIVMAGALAVIWTTESPLALVLVLPALLVLVRSLVGVQPPNDDARN